MGGRVKVDEQVIIAEDHSLTSNIIAIKRIETSRHVTHHKFFTQNRCLAAVSHKTLC